MRGASTISPEGFGRLLVEEWRRGDASQPEETTAAGVAPLSYSQQGIWLAEKATVGPTALAVAFCAAVEGPLEADALDGAVAALVRRHEILRTAFVASGSEPVQKLEAAVAPSLEVTTVGTLAEARSRAEEAAAASFDLERGPLARAQLYTVTPAQHLLLLAAHHIVCDGWSLGVALRELAELYEAALEGRTPNLPPARGFASFARDERGRFAGASERGLFDFWRGRLAGMAPLELPLDRPRRAERTLRGRSIAFEVDRAVGEAARALAAAERASLFMLALAAFSALLHRLSGASDVVVGAPVADARRPEAHVALGPFVNLLALRSDFSGDPTFHEVLRRVRATCLEAYRQRDVPFELLVEELRPERGRGRAPFFDVALAFENAPMPALRLGRATLEPVELEGASRRLDLELYLRERGGSLAGRLTYDPSLFAEATARSLVERLRLVLAAAVADPHRRLSELPLLSHEERRVLVGRWAPGPRFDVPARCLHELVAEQAAARSDAPAVSLGRQTLTYRELDERADRLAARLRAAGVAVEDRVAVLLERSPEFVVALLAVLKAGGAYVPLDPGLPSERLALMLRDSSARALVTTPALLPRLGAAPTVTVVSPELDAPAPDAPAPPRVHPDNLAYVLYTSGSTGRPKGVAVPHRNVVNLLADFERRRPVRPGDRCSVWSSFTFDVSVYEIFSGLVAGGELVLAPDEPRASASAFVEWLAANAVGCAYVPPFMLATLAAAAGAGRLALRRLLVGVEPIEEELLRSIVRALPELALVNGYGPTEATISCTLYDVPRSPGATGRAPIGRSVANGAVYLLDGACEPVPTGCVGELATAAPLARGYLDDPAATAERFVPNPFGPPGSRLYRTGDLARFRRDGNLLFLGRADFQLKVRGHRIEPGEIESALVEHPAVDEAVVVARGEGADRSLAAYVTGEATAAELRDFLRPKLPHYMLPAAFVRLEAFPVTPHGKIDRAALPAPDRESTSGRAYLEPCTPIERQIAAVWAEVLGREQVGASDDFFELGGQSLLGAQATARLRDLLGLEIPLSTLFAYPTVAALAAHLELAPDAMAAAEPVRPRAQLPGTAGEPPPASPGQEQLWLIAALGEEGSRAYNVPAAVAIEGDLDVALLRQALNEIVARHEALRTSLRLVDGELRQDVTPPLPLDLPLVDLADAPQEQKAAELTRLFVAEARHPFDLGKPPLVRARVVRLRRNPKTEVVGETTGRSSPDGGR